MGKKNKRLTRADKIELSNLLKKRQRDLENPNSDLFKQTLDLAVGWEKRLRHETELLKIYESNVCNCEEYCYCDRNIARAEGKVEQLTKELNSLDRKIYDRAIEVVDAEEAAEAALRQRWSDAESQPAIDEGDLGDKLESFVGKGNVSFENYCSSNYTDWEDKIAKPILIANGYEDPYFVDVEADSFGPLIRKVKALKGERVVELFYG